MAEKLWECYPLVREHLGMNNGRLYLLSPERFGLLIAEARCAVLRKNAKSAENQDVVLGVESPQAADDTGDDAHARSGHGIKHKE
eukprot:10532948-Karenia_brevis.AAC.1